MGSTVKTVPYIKPLGFVGPEAESERVTSLVRGITRRR